MVDRVDEVDVIEEFDGEDMVNAEGRAVDAVQDVVEELLVREQIGDQRHFIENGDWPCFHCVTIRSKPQQKDNKETIKMAQDSQ